MNLTKVIEKACKALNDMPHFNGLYVNGAWCFTEELKRSDCERDERSPEFTEKYINDYAVATFDIDTSAPEHDQLNQYLTVNMDVDSAEADFRNWLLVNFFDGDDSSFPKRISIDGKDNEFMKPGYLDKE